MINGFKEYKKYVIANIIGSLVGMLFAVVLSIRYGVYGALISTVTFQSIVFFITLGIVAKSYWFKWKSFLLKFNRNIAVQTGTLFIDGHCQRGNSSCRTDHRKKLYYKNRSITDAGLWEGINRISGMYLMVITASLGVYFLPKLSELKTR